MVTIFGALLLSVLAAGQESSIVQRGTWMATAGPTQVLRGSWSAETLSATPNAARGSWTVLDTSNKVVLEGTWSASKSNEGGWRGAWSARVTTPVSGRSTGGRVFSGTWQAATAITGKTFAEMLRRTIEEQITGSWRSGGLNGNWWLSSSRR